MKVEVLYFAGLREAVGTRPRARRTARGRRDRAAALRAFLRARGGAWAEALAESRTLRVAVDQAMAGGDAPLRDGAEVAFFRAVTGG